MRFSAVSAYWHDSSEAAAKRRLLLLFVLNVSDYVCTLALLHTGLFKEANPLMQDVIGSAALGIFVKVLLPLGLILFALTRLKYADSRQILISNNIALFGVSVYFLLNLYHIFCFCLLAAVGY